MWPRLVGHNKTTSKAYLYIHVYSYPTLYSPVGLGILLASERSERDTLRSVQSRIVDIYIYIIGERAKRARHSQVCSIENRIYIMVRAKFVLITRKEGGV